MVPVKLTHAIDCSAPLERRAFPGILERAAQNRNVQPALNGPAGTKEDPSVVSVKRIISASIRNS